MFSDVFYLLDDLVNVAVGACGAGIFAVQRIQDFGKMARARSDIEQGSGDGENIVNLARMHQAHEWIAHYDDVQIGGGERAGEFRKRLVGKAEEVGGRLRVES